MSYTRSSGVRQNMAIINGVLLIAEVVLDDARLNNKFYFSVFKL